MRAANSAPIPQESESSWTISARFVFFTVRAIEPDARAAVNVVWRNRTFVIRFAASEEPYGSVVFYDEQVAASSSRHQRVTPEVLLSLLDRAKSFRLVQMQYPEAVQQIEHAAPKQVSLYRAVTDEAARRGSYVAAHAARTLAARHQPVRHLVLVGCAAGKWPMPNVRHDTLVAELAARGLELVGPALYGDWSEQWGRRWITCDTSRVATTLAKQRRADSTCLYPGRTRRHSYLHER